MLTAEEKKVRQRESSRKYVAKNLEKVRAYAREHQRTYRKKPERAAYMKEYLRDYYKKNREKYWNYRGVNCTEEVYAQLLNEQNNQCAICHTLPTKKAFAADHDHVTGRIRGLLCHNCNLLIGHARDNANTLHAAIAYLRKSSN